MALTNEFAIGCQIISEYLQNKELNYEELYAITDSIGIPIRILSENSNTILPDDFDSWTLSQQEEFIDKEIESCISQNDELLSSLSYLESAFTYQKDINIEVDGIYFTVKSCENILITDLIADGFTETTTTKGSKVYSKITASNIICVDFDNDLYIESNIIEAQAMLVRSLSDSSPTALQQYSECMNAIKKIMDVINIKWTELQALAQFPEEKLDEAIFEIENRLINVTNWKNNSKISVSKKMKWAIEEDRLIHALAGAKMAKKICGPLVKRLLKAVPFAGYVATLNDCYHKSDNILSLYNSIPEPCPDDAARANSCKNWCYSLWGSVTAVATVDVIGSFSSDATIVGGVIGSFATAGTSLGATAAGAVAKAVIAIGGLVADASIDWSIGELNSEIKTLKCNKKCGEPGMPPCPDGGNGGGSDGGNGNGGGHTSGQPGDEVQIDPSGYVYEGVSSNRVEGVMASCYYKETVEDMYGDLHENVVLWDAEQYAQENPLFTDENGMYRWDVPQGLWQVKFEKEGYETTYSDWLPVPPPQLEVNIGIKQSTQPEVKMARAYEDGIEVEFSKYMQPDLLNTENIFVTKNGEIATGCVKLLNEEQSYEGKAETYASKVRFVPETAFLTTDEVVLTVSRKVKSYAGIPMLEDYTQEFDIEKEVKSLVADSIVKVPYGGTKQMTISALPYDAAIGKKLVVKSSSSMIATVNVDTLVMNENGQVTVTLAGELPGTSVVTFALADADVNGMSTVQVAILEEKVTANPTASRVSGTAVYRGTEVALSCETEGAVIYYTLDGSCPCDEAAQIEYKEPIVITEDSVVIKAMAVAEDMYESDVMEFRYTLKKTTLSLSLKEGWNWVSHNVETPVAATELEKNAVRIVSQTEELVNDPTYGLIGNLDSISPVEAYKVQVSENTEYTLTGYEYNAATPISISAGWNWLGYPVNQVMSVDEAFANATPTEGDCIVGQNGFALYSDGVWTGTLLTLNPGIGYMYQAKVGYEFAYNTSIVSKAKALYGKGIANGTPWTADKYKYPKVMCVVADLFVDGEVANEYSVGAFCGTECRGVGKYVDGKLMISVYGSGNEKIAFVAMDNETGKTFSVTEEVVFTETLLGSIKQAYPLHIGETTGVQGIFSGWKVRIEGDNLYLTADDKVFDRVTLTDVYGNVVCVAENLSQGEAINVATLSDGVYIVAAEQDGIMYYKKIMKAGK